MKFLSLYMNIWIIFNVRNLFNVYLIRNVLWTDIHTQMYMYYTKYRQTENKQAQSKVNILLLHTTEKLIHM